MPAPRPTSKLPQPTSSVAPLNQLVVTPLLLLFAAVGTFCYPALNVGNSTGFAYATLLGLACISVGIIARHIRILEIPYWALVLPYLISGFIILNRSEIINYRNVVVGSVAFCISLSAIFLPRMFVACRRVDLLVLGAALGFLAHFLVGVFQYLLTGSFPEIYYLIFDNNSFALATFSTRPMGVFSEPSAMTGTMGPLILVIYQLVDRRVPLVGEHGQAWRFFVKAACYAGLALVAASLSGFAPLVVLAFSLVALHNLAFVRKKYLLSLGALSISLVGIALCLWLLEDRLSIELSKSSSWQTRWDSMIVAVDIWTSDVTQFILGVGANQLHFHMERMGTYSAYGTLQWYANVFSITLIYLVETGVFGLLGFCIVLGLSGRSIWRSANRFGGYTALGLWIIGSTFIASYYNLYGVWFTLGLFPLWAELFPREFSSRPADESRR